MSPSTVFYLVSLNCNERCSKCSHWQSPKDDCLVETGRVLTAVVALPSVEELVIVGGEPLLHKERLLLLIAGLTNTKVRTTIVTNGTLCSGDFIDKLIGEDVHLVFSIDTLDEGKWDWIRGRRSKARVISNFAYARGKLEPEQLSVQSVLAKETIADVEAVGDWCREIGVTQTVQPYLAEGFGGRWTPIEDAEPNGYVEPGKVKRCMAAGRNLSIMPDGTVLTCFQQRMISGAELPLGNLNEQSVEEIKSSTYASEVVSLMQKCELPCKVLKCNQ